MNRDTHGVGVGDRGQSVFDFSIGVSLFLVVVLAVLVFVPTAFGSLSDDAGIDSEDTLAAERVADYLVETALDRSAASPGLDPICVLTYFGDGTECSFASDDSFAADSARAETQPLNVTIEADVTGGDAREILCYQGGSLVPAASCGTGDTRLTAGPSELRNRNYVAATRLAQLQGRDVFVVVRTW
jgi:hypothetical protein